MVNKNLENETKTVAVPTMSSEEMEKYIKTNLSIVPRNMRRKFEELSSEQKVEKIRMYMDIRKVREEVFEKNKLENRVKELFIKRKATTEEVVKVIDFCKQYIQSTKEQEINKLQDEIDRLTHLKHALESN